VAMEVESPHPSPARRKVWAQGGGLRLVLPPPTALGICLCDTSQLWWFVDLQLSFKKWVEQTTAATAAGDV